MLVWGFVFLLIVVLAADSRASDRGRDFRCRPEAGLSTFQSFSSSSA